VVQDGVITIPPRGYGLISSHERFLFNDKVFAFVSQISDVALSGLRLNHSATIDPYYSGRLEMGIENLLDTEVPIRVGMNLGKIVFFNVADSRPLDSPDKTISQSKYRRRGQDAPDPGELIWA
jgi:deoxycytidine triphosphate deaminase